MIYYDGTSKRDKVKYLKFKNNLGKSVEIPVDDRTHSLIMIYLEKLQPPEPKPVERGNDEESL